MYLYNNFAICYQNEKIMRKHNNIELQPLLDKYISKNYFM